MRKQCVDVLNLEDSANLHSVLEEDDSVIFVQPAPIMRPGMVISVDYRYLALTYTKEYIKYWLTISEKIEYCDTDPTNILFQQKTPYVLSPLHFNCENSYVSLWDILHIIYSKQRIFYVLPSHTAYSSKHKCMKNKETSEEIIKIGICVGDDCWKWTDEGCIKQSRQEKVTIQTECNKEKYENYIRRHKMVEIVEKEKKEKEYFLKRVNIENDLKRFTKKPDNIKRRNTETQIGSRKK